MENKIPPTPWAGGVIVPMPKIYIPDGNFIGKKVVLHMCEFHEDCDPATEHGYTREDVSLTGNCNCALKGKEVTITGTKKTPRATFYRSICYTIAESPNLINEVEFSPESRESVDGIVKGYIIEGEPGFFLHAGYDYVELSDPLEGYIFNTGLVKAILKDGLVAGKPTKAYPAKQADYGIGVKEITGKPIAWSYMRRVIYQ